MPYRFGIPMLKTGVSVGRYPNRKPHPSGAPPPRNLAHKPHPLGASAVGTRQRGVCSGSDSAYVTEDEGGRKPHRKESQKHHLNGCNESHLNGCNESHLNGCNESHLNGCNESHLNGCNESHLNGCNESHLYW
ncbi:hypothetical protein MAR_007564 [Mya arenaria]|uniref:Uncharacterized protein n=1 Tax=Mya arenaria TaxID=6604 RepID=A0ABY7DDU0_MYAAR|nr:hypothetical protein MAR_007564 [Mya arenaria]